VGPVRTLDGAEVDRQRGSPQDRTRRRRRGSRQPQVAGEQVPRAAGHERERDAASHRPGGNLHRGAVATVAHEHVEALGSPFLGEAAGITRAGGGQHLDRPSPPA
jgi:hypothetical protein